MIGKARVAKVRGMDWIVIWPPLMGGLIGHSNIAEAIIFEITDYIWKQ
jgi:hypothetical protein